MSISNPTGTQLMNSDVRDLMTEIGAALPGTNVEGLDSNDRTELFVTRASEWRKRHPNALGRIGEAAATACDWLDQDRPTMGYSGFMREVYVDCGADLMTLGDECKKFSQLVRQPPGVKEGDPEEFGRFVRALKFFCIGE